MKQYSYLLSLICALFITLPCNAQQVNDDPVDEQYRECIKIDSTSGNICTCAYIAYGKYNEQMNKTYKKLLKSLKLPKEKTVLQQSQTAWMAYRDAEFKTYDVMFNLPGDKWCGIRQYDRLEIVKARIISLKNYLIALEKK